jgi:hypothetical protein
MGATNTRYRVMSEATADHVRERVEARIMKYPPYVSTRHQKAIPSEVVAGVIDEGFDIVER